MAWITYNNAGAQKTFVAQPQVSVASIAFTDGDDSRRVTITDSTVTTTNKVVICGFRRSNVTSEASNPVLYTGIVESQANGSFDVFVSSADWGDESPSGDPLSETVTMYYLVAS